MNKLDCLLISPSIFYRDRENIWKEINSNFPPPGLAYLAGYAREKGYSVRVIDCNIEAPTVESFRPFFEKNYAQKFSSVRVIGLTAVTSTIKKAYKIAEICKEYYPESLIVLGGPHATFVTNEVINNKLVDIVVVGEGELTLAEILEGKKMEEIRGIVFKKSGDQIITNPPRERIADLDSLPMPAYDLFPILKYKPAKGSYKKLPAMNMMTSRGCPGRCTFCNKTLGAKLVFKSAQKILEEIKYLVENYGIKEILFYDDTFTVYRENVIKLCDLLGKDGLGLSWTCFARVDYVNYEMLKKMRMAGCHQIMYGVENIDENILKNINKNIDPEQVANAVRWTKSAGIDCRLAFMVGNPGDNEQIIKKNIKFINKLNPDLLVVNIATPFPGTQMFDWAEKRGLILTHDWDDYTLAKPVMRLENLDVQQIQNLYKSMYKNFYFRPNFIFKKMLAVRTIQDFKILLDGLKALLSFLAPKRKKI